MTLKSSKFELSKRFVNLPNGNLLSYAEFGPSSGPPAMFIHGFTDSALTWLPLIPHFPSDRRLILVDLRGHGASSQPETGYRLEDLAGDMALFISAMKLDGVDLVGHSLGSLVAQRVAQELPTIVNRLALISSTATAFFSEDEQRLADAIAELKDPIDPDSEFLVSWFTNPNPVDPEFLALERRGAAQMPAHIWRTIFNDALNLKDLTASFEKLEAPVLLIWGGMDPIFGPRHRASLQSALPKASVKLYVSLGHNPFWEEPALIAGDLTDFFRQPPLRNSTASPRP